MDLWKQRKCSVGGKYSDLALIRTTRGEGAGELLKVRIAATFEISPVFRSSSKKVRISGLTIATVGGCTSEPTAHTMTVYIQGRGTLHVYLSTHLSLTIHRYATLCTVLTIEKCLLAGGCGA